MALYPGYNIIMAVYYDGYNIANVENPLKKIKIIVRIIWLSYYVVLPEVCFIFAISKKTKFTDVIIANSKMMLNIEYNSYFYWNTALDCFDNYEESCGQFNYGKNERNERLQQDCMSTYLHATKC